jgi:uncharacterized cysteine cluster protein YcgN (CxxCxxCC family)
VAFWEEKSLRELNAAEWESLCDGCARCCLIKLEDEDSGRIYFTSLVCELLDTHTCRCGHYPDRHRLIPDCIELDADLAQHLRWLPATCAYRRLAEGKSLPEWHPLISGDPESVHAAGISVRGKVIPVTLIHEDEHEDHIIDWVEH